MRALRWLGAIALALLVALLLALWWLVGSGSGRDWTFERVLGLLPEGTLSIGSREGSLGGGLRLYDVVYEDEGRIVRIDVLELKARPAALLGRELHLSRVAARGLDYRAKPAPNDPTKPPLAWPALWPQLPVGLRIDALFVDATQGTLEGQLQYAASGERPLAAQLRVKASAGADLTLSVEGGPARGALRVEGQAGSPVSLALDWQDGGPDWPAWRVDAAADGLRLAALGFPESAPVAFTIEADGTATAANLQGRVMRSGLAVEIQPSRIERSADALLLAPLDLRLLDGALRVEGRYGFDDGAVALDAAATALAWGEGEARVEASGTATVEGKTDDWRAAVDVDLTRGAQSATLVARASGSASGATLQPFTLRAGGGTLEGEAAFDFTDGTAVTASGALSNFDPSWLQPGWPGRLGGALSFDGRFPESGEPSWQAAVRELRGELRGAALTGRASAEAAAGRTRTDVDLRVGDGRVQAKGTVSPALDVSLELERVALAPWVADAAGMLDATLRVRGAAAQPSIDGRIEASDLVIAGQALDRVALSAEGERFELEADRAEKRIAAAGTWQTSDGFRQGRVTLDRLDIDVENVPDVALLGDAVVRWSPDGVSLPAPACLRLGQEGRLCVEGGAEALRVEGQGLQLSWLQPWLPDDGDLPLRPEGELSLQAALGFGDDDWTLTGAVSSPAGTLSLADGSSDAPDFRWSDLALQVSREAQAWAMTLDATLQDEGRIEARATAAPDGALEGRLALRLDDLSLLELLVADIADPSGRIDGALELAGSVDAPLWSGRIAASALAFDLPALGIAVADGTLGVEGKGDGSLTLSGRLPTGDGALTVDGRVGPGDAPLRLTISGDSVRVLDTPDARVWISPAIDVELKDNVVAVTGEVAVPRALIVLDGFEQTVSASPDVVVIDDPPGDEGMATLLDATLKITLGDDVRLRGFGFDGRLSGAVAVRDRPDREARASGSLALSGELRAYGQQLDLTRGDLRWANAPISEPVLDVRAVRPGSEPEVGVTLTGSALAPVAEVWSQPTLPQAEALSLLMFGRPLASADGQDAAQLQQAATTLGGSAVAQALAGRVGLDSASVGQSRALGGTAVTFGKRINPKLYVSYGMALSGTGQVVTVTYALRRWLSLQLESGLEERLQLEATFSRD